MRMPEDGPLGDTRFEANGRAIVAASLVNNPAGGWVESVLTLATHLTPFRPALFLRLVVLEVLDRFFMRLCCLATSKSSQVAPFAGLGVFLAGVQAILSTLQFSDHEHLPRKIS